MNYSMIRKVVKDQGDLYSFAGNKDSVCIKGKHRTLNACAEFSPLDSSP